MVYNFIPFMIYPIYNTCLLYTSCAAWKKHALEKDELSVRIGRWNIPGEPIVILVDFQPFFEKKDDIYTEMWNRYQVDSLHAYGDYDEASMFSYAAGRVVESFYRYNLTETDKVVYLSLIHI